MERVKSYVARKTPRAKDGCGLCVLGDALYPPLLYRVADAPTLFFRGELETCAGRLVAIVGTRTPTASERAWSGWLGAALAREGLTVCSGYAPGVDRAAHRAVLAAGGRTVAVLGEPVGVIRARGEMEGLGVMNREVVARGCFLGEQPPTKGHLSKGEAVAALLARNRLIAGLSLAVVVVAAGERGGAHWTADHAWKIGAPVFVADFGELNPVGNCRLLLRGAEPLDARRPSDAFRRLLSSLESA